MRSIQVHFPSGREVLSNYWGFLHHGGLVLREVETDLAEGDDVVLDVKIKSLKQTYRFAGRVVKKTERAFVAFADGQDQEVMLNAAWADSHDVPQRKHRRYPIGREVRYAVAGAPEKSARGHLLNVSPGGCRLKGATVLPPGARVQVHAQGLQLEGQVRWSSAAGEMGIEFSRPDLVVQALLDHAV
jgi:PilZ domain